MKSVTHCTRLDPRYFAHGRLLYRFPGSDACRFSPKLAYRLLEQLSPAEVLWDPCCGSGLILAVASAFFSDKFGRLIGSDINPKAVICSRDNLKLFTCAESRQRRLREIRGFQGLNPKSAKRWAEVEDYYTELFERPLGLDFEVFEADISNLPPACPTDKLCMISDLPYERQSCFQGKSIEDPLESLPVSEGLFVSARRHSALWEHRPLKGGRWLIHRPRKTPNVL